MKPARNASINTASIIDRTNKSPPPDPYKEENVAQQYHAA
jgi:hypothetical protein